MDDNRYFSPLINNNILWQFQAPANVVVLPQNTHFNWNVLNSSGESLLKFVPNKRGKRKLQDQTGDFALKTLLSGHFSELIARYYLW